MLQLTKKNFITFKKLITVNVAVIDKMVISGKFKHNDKCFRYFISYADYNIITSLFIVLPQMRGYIKYFDDDGKYVSFKIEDDNIFLKCNEVWNKIGMKFHSQPIYHKKSI